MRITEKDLRGYVQELNELVYGNPSPDYLSDDLYRLGTAYGRYQLAHSRAGSTGIHDITGYIPARELFRFLEGYLAAMRKTRKVGEE